MTRTFARLTLAAVAALAAAGGAAGQFSYPVKIESVAVGLPPGRFGEAKDAGTQKALPVAKRGLWAPLYLNLEVQKELSGGALVRVETPDGDDLRTTVTVPLGVAFDGQLPGAKLTPADFGYVPYARSGGRGGSVTVTLLSNDGKERVLAEPFQVKFQQYRESSSYVVMSLGSRLPGFSLPGEDRTGSQRAGLRGGRVETAAVTAVAEMPDQWLGYQAVDLVVLPTGAVPAPFLAELFSENAPPAAVARRQALLEWVARGGKLVVSVGAKAGELGQFKAFQALLPRPLQVDPAARPADEVALDVSAGGSAITDRLRSRVDPPVKFPVANLGPAPAGRPARTLVPPAADAAAGPPVVVQATRGLGRITLVAFDLDQSPFLDYPSRAVFWDYLLREAGAQKPALAPPNQANNSYAENPEDEWLQTLRGHVDTFDGVPVVSFGWVALFIALYTLVIGPLEYLFLKYVLGRLELTWITFPLIVASVSAAAYFTAYAIKGNDLKVNKVDLVDYDLAGGRVYGKSWFTVFSPRIDSYTVGVQPRPGVATDLPGGPAPVVGWMGGGAGGGGGGIVSRGYTVHAQPQGGGVTVGDGLERVPIQVWSTKAFAGEWVGGVDPAAPPVTAELFHPPGRPNQVAGAVTVNLPFGTIQNAVLLYAGKAYTLPALSPGQRVAVPAGGLKEDPYFFTTAGQVNLAAQQDQNVPAWQRQSNPVPVAVSKLNIAGMLFHDRVTGAGTKLANSSLRAVDQSWRVGDATRPATLDEAVLVGSVAPPPGPAEPMMTDPAGPSATLVWLKELPSSGKPRPAVPGTLRQETFIRVFIPIPPAAAK